MARAVIAAILVLSIGGCGPAQEHHDRPQPELTTLPVAADQRVAAHDTSTVGEEPRTVASGLRGGRYQLIVSLLPTTPGVRDFHWSLVEPQGDSAIVRARAPLAADAVWFDQRVFAFEALDLVLADFGNEYSWGTLALAIDSRGMARDLHLPELAAVATDAEDAMGPGMSALPFVSATLQGIRVRLEFQTDLIEDPGGREQRLHCRIDPSQPIVLEQDAVAWAMKNVRTSPLTDFDMPTEPCRKGSA